VGTDGRPKVNRGTTHSDLGKEKKRSYTIVKARGGKGVSREGRASCFQTGTEERLDSDELAGPIVGVGGGALRGVR